MTEQDSVLNAINKVRTSCGAETLDRLPLGIRHDPQGCVIARSFNDIEPSVTIYQQAVFVRDIMFAEKIAEGFDYTNDIVEWERNDKTVFHAVPIPTELMKFINRFDQGVYPDLILI